MAQRVMNKGLTTLRRVGLREGWGRCEGIMGAERGGGRRYVRHGLKLSKIWVGLRLGD